MLVRADILGSLLAIATSTAKPTPERAALQYQYK